MKRPIFNILIQWTLFTRIRSVFFDTMGSRARAGDILSIMLFTLLVRVERKKLSNPDHFCAHVDRFD